MGSHAVSSNIGRAQGWRRHLNTQAPSLIEHRLYVARAHQQLLFDLLLRQHLDANRLVLKTAARARRLNEYFVDFTVRVGNRVGGTHSLRVAAISRQSASHR